MKNIHQGGQLKAVTFLNRCWVFLLNVFKLISFLGLFLWFGYYLCELWVAPNNIDLGINIDYQQHVRELHS